MELKDIVSVSGMPGLHKVVGRNKNGLIVETIGTGKKFSTTLRQKVSVLADIAIFTQDGEMKLWEAIKNIRSKEDAGTQIPGAKSADSEVKDAMAFAVPGFDSEKVYISDMKKLFSWYHMLRPVLDFDKLGKEEDAENGEEKSAENTTAKTVKEKAAPKQMKTVTPKTSGGAKSKTTTPRKMGS